MLKVKVCLPQTIMKQQPFLTQYQGRVMTVVASHRLRRDLPYYFELEGAVSKKGKPYFFMREWLDPITTIVE